MSTLHLESGKAQPSERKHNYGVLVFDVYAYAYIFTLKLYTSENAKGHIIGQNVCQYLKLIFINDFLS